MQKTFYLLIICFLSTNFLYAQWTKTNGIRGGDTWALMTYGDTVVATIGNELYFSTNHGKTWLPIATPDYSSVSPFSTDGQNIIGWAYDLNEQGYRCFRTDDFFQTLHLVSIADTLSLYELFLAHGYIYGSGHHGVFRTNNDGATWEYVTTAQISNLMFDGQRMTGTRYNFVLQSTDQGFNWDTLTQYSSYPQRVFQHEHLIILFMYDDSQGSYVSTDFGQTWNQYLNTGFSEMYKFAWHNGTIFGVGGDKMIKSSNAGQTWEDVPLPTNSSNPAYHVVSSGNALILGGYQSVGSSGIYRSADDGNSWVPVSSDITAASGKLRPVSHDLFVASNGGLFKSINQGANWTKLNLNIPQPANKYWLVSDFVKSGGNWVISDLRLPWVSVDGGVSWVKSIMPNASWFDSHEIMDLETAKNKIVGGGYGTEFYQYFISHDNGLSFQELEILTDQHQTLIRSLDISEDRVFALGYDKELYRSDNGCDTWVTQSTTIPTDSLSSNDLNENSLLVCGDVMVVSSSSPNKMLYSKDAGQTWEYYNLDTDGLLWGNRPFKDLIRIGNKLVAATQNGIYFSENEGADWAAWNDGLLQLNITNIKIHNGLLWAAAVGGGIWKRPLSQLGMRPTPDHGFFEIDLRAQPNVPSQLNFLPNPASQSVQVSTGGEAGNIRFQDVSGRVVLWKSIGTSGLEISISELPQGIYQVLFVGEKTTLRSQLVVQR